LVRLQTPIAAIQASTKSIELPACEVFRVEGEKIKSSSHYFRYVHATDTDRRDGRCSACKKARDKLTEPWPDEININHVSQLAAVDPEKILNQTMELYVRKSTS
jgi:hypothetical protein